MEEKMFVVFFFFCRTYAWKGASATVILQLWGALDFLMFFRANAPPQSACTNFLGALNRLNGNDPLRKMEKCGLPEVQWTTSEPECNKVRMVAKVVKHQRERTSPR